MFNELLTADTHKAATHKGAYPAMGRTMVNFHRQSIQVPEDLRRYPRIEFHIPVRVMGMNEDAQIIDFSLNGFYIQIESTASLNEGQLVHLAVKFPGESQSSIIKVKIMRLESQGFGCQFVDLDSRLREMLHINFELFKDTFPIE